MRYVYSENEPIEKHPPRKWGEEVVVINKATHMPEVAINTTFGLCFVDDEGTLFKLSPYNWEIAWP